MVLLKSIYYLLLQHLLLSLLLLLLLQFIYLFIFYCRAHQALPQFPYHPMASMAGLFYQDAISGEYALCSFNHLIKFKRLLISYGLFV